MYYAEINGDKITGKGYISTNIELAENQVEITEEVYNQLIRMPADFEIDTEDNIVSVTCPPEPEPMPQPPSLEQRIQALEEAMLASLGL